MDHRTSIRNGSSPNTASEPQMGPRRLGTESSSDSLQEGDGFELLVPRRESRGFSEAFRESRVALALARESEAPSRPSLSSSTVVLILSRGALTSGAHIDSISARRDKPPGAPHSHIPVPRGTPFPGGGDVPKPYYEVMDPFGVPSSQSTAWRRASLRALQCGQPACAGRGRRRHGSGANLSKFSLDNIQYVSEIATVIRRIASAIFDQARPQLADAHWRPRHIAPRGVRGHLALTVGVSKNGFLNQTVWSTCTRALMRSAGPKTAHLLRGPRVRINFAPAGSQGRTRLTPCPAQTGCPSDRLS
jgi:hypothetical protein